MMDDPLLYVRAAHFAATMALGGVVFFVVFIAAPVFGRAADAAPLAAAVAPRFRRLAWTALALSAVSGAAWLVVVAQSMGDRTLPEIFSKGILWLVLTQTGFGRDWLARAVIAALLAAALASFPSDKTAGWLKAAAALLAAGLVGSLAWSGHAAGGSGSEAVIHPAADFLHLVAAAAWLGMLIPLAMVLGAARKQPASLAAARAATVRFSNFGVAGVGTLLITGSVNTFYLAGSIAALTQTDYGRLLLAKVALFLVMAATAAVNRLRLTPRLAQPAHNIDAAADALRQLRRNTLLEVAIGAAIIAIVAALGINPDIS